MLTFAQQSSNKLMVVDPALLWQINNSSNRLPDLRISHKGENPRTKGLGRLIQDANGAASLNKNLDNLKLGTSGSKGTNLWGFRFMYNPTDITYSTSSNNQIDWSLGSKDPANLLTGNQSVSIQLYFNRIPDMAYLRAYKNSNGFEKVSPLNTKYGYNISSTAIDGILNRGTEYDIEYLYRVVNGDPIKNALLFGDKYKGYTSDFGYTTATPCWLYINDNMRYFGSVSSISVYHRIFTLDMIPMFTVVTLSFNRYPAVWNEPALGTSFGDLYGDKGSLKTSLGTDNTAGTAKSTDKPGIN
jgi:hypothetical protein